MSREVRFDFAESLAHPRYFPDGSAMVSGRAARTGAHEYSWGTERRDQAELASIVRQLPGKPVTVGHPQGMVARGHAAEVVGTVKSSRLDGDHAEVELHVSPQGLAVMRAGQSALSLGYETDAVAGWQTKTRVDHLALVRTGRCGATCSIRTDCAGACACAAKPEPALEVRAFYHLAALGAGA